jgi:hypothetical protein
VLDAAALVGVEDWPCSLESWTESTSHGESCIHHWWVFERAFQEQVGHEQLFHGCGFEVVKEAVQKGVLPGPRQEGRKAAAIVAFASSWPFVGSYVGPSAVRSGKAVKHLGCVLRVVGKNVRKAQNPDYRQAESFDVAAVMLRPWLFDLSKELGPRQSCANAGHNPYDWDAAARKKLARQTLADHGNAVEAQEKQQVEPAQPQEAARCADCKHSLSRCRCSRSQGRLEGPTLPVVRRGEPESSTWTRTRSEAARGREYRPREAAPAFEEHDEKRRSSQRASASTDTVGANGRHLQPLPEQKEAFRQRKTPGLELQARGRPQERATLERGSLEEQRGGASRGGQPSPKRSAAAWKQTGQPYVEQARQSRNVINNKRKGRRAAAAKRMAVAREGEQGDGGRSRTRSPSSRCAGARVPLRTVRGLSRSE